MRKIVPAIAGTIFVQLKDKREKRVRLFVKNDKS